MLGLVSALFFGGYLLIYAAVANGGVLAAKPWQALWVDAYDENAVQKAAGGSSGGGGVGGFLRRNWRLFIPIPGLGGFLP